MAADGPTRRESPPTRRGRFAGLWGALIGGVLGFGVGAAVYLAITPTLESATGLIRELQGLSWNLVPGLTILGAVIGLLIGLARRRRILRSDS
jgi:cell division protein FtsX